MAALIRRGSFEDFAARAAVQPQVREALGGAYEALSKLSTVGELQQAMRDAEVVPEFPVSDGNRGLALKSFMLEKGFEGFIRNLWGSSNEIYMVSWAWDLSGAAPVVEPAPADAEKYTHSLQPGERTEYVGDGRLLFPARPVTAGIALRIQICESDRELRKAGETLESVRKAVDDSKLTNVLKLVAIAGGPTTATLTLIKDAASELSKVVSAILKANTDDFVDLYEGYFSATGPWPAGVADEERGSASHLALNRLT